jgi:hypothetical protein
VFGGVVNKIVEIKKKKKKESVNWYC